jgi:hypothetical protein
MPKITKEEAIEIGNKMMEEHLFYRLSAIRYVDDEAENPFWSIVYLRLDKDGNSVKIDPSTSYIIVDAETGDAHFRMTL